MKLPLTEDGLALSLAIADIDFFKSYNDRYGHPEGDIALRTISQALTGRLRQEDKIARFGGEEFIFLFPDTDETQCYQVCVSTLNRSPHSDGL